MGIIVEDKDLMTAIAQIHEKAAQLGLDGFQMRYEICPADIIYTFGAYGMPVRFSHWSFGKAFHRMKTQYDFNLSRIYELVINSDPCHAFLLESNSLLQNKVIIAHVLGHSDFFKHNYRFAQTSRSMVETMAVHAARIRRYEMRYGRDEVEKTLDAAIALQEQVDPYAPPWTRHDARSHDADVAPLHRDVKATPYDDLWELDERPSEMEKEQHDRPPSGTDEQPKDLLLYIIENGRHLSDWQRDIIGIIRTEMLYFWPQLETKIVNEGWATYWHARIMNNLDLNEAESVDFARMHANVLAPSRTHINPYRVGYEILRDIERRWNRSTEKLFEVRTTETDISLLRNYLTKDLVEKLDLYVYAKDGDKWVVTDNDWEVVRDELVRHLTNCGIPVIVVRDGDYRKNGELLLRHRYEGVELDLHYMEQTLPYVYRLWGRPVHLETVVDDQWTTFSCAGGSVIKE